jgi:ribonuclease E
MTEELDPAGAQVQDPPGAEAPEAPERSDRSGGPETATSDARPRSAARRGRRGGRGRGGSRAGARPPASGPSKASGESEGSQGSEGSEGSAGSAAPREAVEAASEGAGSAPNDGAGTATPHRRRRRGGRGRGGRGGSSPAAATPEAATPEGEEGSAGADLDVEPPQPEPRPEVASAEALEGVDVVEGEGAETPGTSAARRRRRRGGRGRGRSRAPGAASPAAEREASSEPESEAPSEPEAEAEAEAEGEAAAASKPRRRARSAAPKAEAGEAEGAPRRAARGRAKAEPETTAPAGRARTRRPRTRKAEGAEEGDEAAAVSTAAPTRLRRGRTTSAGARRRREPMPIVPRVTDKLMVITEHGDRDQIAILEERALVQHYVTRAGARSMVGNVYLGRVQNVLPGMEAAFVDVGRGRNAVLYAGEVNYAPEDLEGKQPPRIEQVLKSGQSVLVQVTKDPIGGKGARLTAKISMPGRYLVLQPNWEITGISKRLPDNERRRLRALLKKVRPEGHGLIVRTAAEEAAEEDLRADVERLVREWKAIEKKAKKSKAPAVLYEEPELTVRVVRDLFTNEEYRELVTDSERVHGLVTEYLAGVAPDLLPKVRLHTGKLPAFEEFHVVEQIHKGLDRKVWLPSGGYLVIDRTEAMTVIDVNTGKSVGKTNLEETVVNTNLEAAREVARQLRLRDIGGMIIIDFIDMLFEQNKRRVVDTLREEMARDKTRSQVFDISPLGLLEVTRKRVSGGLLESFSETCPTCEGRGVILTYEA